MSVVHNRDKIHWYTYDVSISTNIIGAGLYLEYKTIANSHMRIYLYARPPSFPARTQMSLSVCDHEFDAHVPPNGGELTNHSYHKHQQ